MIEHARPRSQPGLCILSCSPRRGGNSDTAARIFLENWTQAGKEKLSTGTLDRCTAGGQNPPPRHAEWNPHASVQLVYLREHHVASCIACGGCARFARQTANTSNPDKPDNYLDANGFFLGCPFSVKDDSTFLLRALAGAASLALISPVYFYHLPAQLKALIDRTQPFWELQQSVQSSIQAKKRFCHVILLGARPKGDKLFEGSLLSLRYALAPLGITLPEPLLLYGLEKPADLSLHAEYMRKIGEYAKDAAQMPHPLL